MHCNTNDLTMAHPSNKQNDGLDSRHTGLTAPPSAHNYPHITNNVGVFTPSTNQSSQSNQGDIHSTMKVSIEDNAHVPNDSIVYGAARSNHHNAPVHMPEPCGNNSMITHSPPVGSSHDGLQMPMCHAQDNTQMKNSRGPCATGPPTYYVNNDNLLNQAPQSMMVYNQLANSSPHHLRFDTPTRPSTQTQQYSTNSRPLGQFLSSNIQPPPINHLPSHVASQSKLHQSQFPMQISRRIEYPPLYNASRNSQFAIQNLSGNSGNCPSQSQVADWNNTYNASSTNYQNVLPQRDCHYDMPLPQEMSNKSVEQVKGHIHRYAVTIVCGAPMVGKSTIVSEALSLSQHRPYHIMCKGLYTFDSILCRLKDCLQLGCDINQFNAADCIHRCLGMNITTTLVFHKCETLRDRWDFLKFLCRLHTVSGGHIKSAVTTYKHFDIPHQYHQSFGQMQIGLMNNVEIGNFIRFHVGSALPDIEGYAQMIIRNNLCFPLGVWHVIETYLQPAQQDYIQTADDIDRQIKKSSFQFLSKIFHERVPEVETWVSVSKRKWIALLCLSHDATSSKDLLREMVRSDGEDDSAESIEWSDLLKTFAVSRVPGLDRLQFHPLLIYYIKLEKIALEGMWFDISCNKVVKFLCNVLLLTDEMTACVGHKSAIFQCALPEWPNVKNILQMAVHCNRHTYKDFCQVALVGANLMVKWFTSESVQFFQSLYDYACHPDEHQTKSLKRQAAILEGLMAHAIHNASGNSQKGSTWDTTEGHFKSALQVLIKDGASFYLAQLYSMYGRALSYQGHYALAIEYCEKGKAMMMELPLVMEREDHMTVSKGRRDDLDNRLDVNLAMPLIFTGHNDEASEILLKSLDQMKKSQMDFATLDHVYNLLGLAAQRGEGNKEAALTYYKASLKERMDLRRFCPTQLVVPLNNIAMLEMEFGNIGREEIEEARTLLEDALNIQRRNNRWNGYYTALTLLHKSEVCMASNDLHQAFKDAEEAKDILDANCNKHDLRFHLQHHMAHIRMALEQEKESIILALKKPVPSTSSRTRDSSTQSRDISLFEHGSGMGIDPHSQSVFSTLSRSIPVENYFENVLQLGKESVNDLSDNSHHYVLSTLEHLILLNGGNPEKMLYYYTEMAHIFTTYPWMIQEFNKPNDDISQRMKDHRKFYTVLGIIKCRLASCLNPDSIFLCVLKHCKACKISQKYFDSNAWLTRCCHFITEQQAQRSRCHRVRAESNLSHNARGPLSGLPDPEVLGQEAELRPPPAMPHGPALKSHFTPSSTSQTATASGPQVSPAFRPLDVASKRRLDAESLREKNSRLPNTSVIPSLTTQRSSNAMKCDDAVSAGNASHSLTDKDNFQLVTVHSKIPEESSDYNCHSKLSSHMNQTYAHVSEHRSVSEIDNTGKKDTTEAMPELNENWTHTYHTYLTPSSSLIDQKELSPQQETSGPINVRELSGTTPMHPILPSHSEDKTTLLSRSEDHTGTDSKGLLRLLKDSYYQQQNEKLLKPDASEYQVANQHEHGKDFYNKKEGLDWYGSNSTLSQTVTNDLLRNNDHPSRLVALPAQTFQSTHEMDKGCSSQSYGGARPKTRSVTAQPTSQGCNAMHPPRHCSHDDTFSRVPTQSEDGIISNNTTNLSLLLDDKSTSKSHPDMWIKSTSRNMPTESEDEIDGPRRARHEMFVHDFPSHNPEINNHAQYRQKDNAVNSAGHRIATLNLSDANDTIIQEIQFTYGKSTESKRKSAESESGYESGQDVLTHLHSSNSSFSVSQLDDTSTCIGSTLGAKYLSNELIKKEDSVTLLGSSKTSKDDGHWEEVKDDKEDSTLRPEPVEHDERDLE